MIPLINLAGGRRHPFGRAQGQSHIFPTDEEKTKTAQAWVAERNRLLTRHNEHRKDHGLDPMPAERAQRFVQPPSELEAYIFNKYHSNRRPMDQFNEEDTLSAQEDYYELLTEAYGDAEEWEKVYADEWAKLFKVQHFGRIDERRNMRAQFYNDDDDDDDDYGDEDPRMPRGLGEPVDGAGGVGGRAGLRGLGGMGPGLFGKDFGAGFGGGKRRGRR